MVEQKVIHIEENGKTRSLVLVEPTSPPGIYLVTHKRNVKSSTRI